MSSVQVKNAPSTPAVTTPVKPKKRMRFKPGTVALREIRKQQKSTQNILQRAPFVRMVRKSTAQYGEQYKFSASAMSALQDLTEAYIIAQIKKAHTVALYTGRKSLKANDLSFVQNLQNL